ncbi:hypothetical protein GX865_01925 [Candidatus Saccharibacteria bacterium]|jgi:hypothetical protein|nr:hypothetical protein [Candidatus Saccharibacteria bacterium]
MTKSTNHPRYDNQKPMLEPVSLGYQRVFSGAEYKKLQDGLWAEDMDDKWDIYMYGETVHISRSWTGHEMFRLKLRKVDDGFEIIDVQAEASSGRRILPTADDMTLEILDRVLSQKLMEANEA